MKSILLFLFFQLLLLHLNAQSKVAFTNEKDSASYAAGLNEGERMFMMLQQAGADTILNQELFLQGLISPMRGK